MFLCFMIKGMLEMSSMILMLIIMKVGMLVNLGTILGKLTIILWLGVIITPMGILMARLLYPKRGK